MQKLAEYKRSMCNIPVVAITGSVGKTSTKDMIASVLSQKYKVLKTQGNYNNEIGMPLTLLSLKDEEVMVLEMGMNSFGEISLLSRIAKPDVAVITNIGTAHIGLLGSRENILKAKLEILEGLNKNGTVVVNYDNDLLNEWYEKEKNNYNIITYGTQQGSKVLGQNAVFHKNGSTCEAVIDSKTYNVHIPVGGEHFVSNSLCALSVAKIFEIPVEEAIKGIENFELTKKRMEIKQAKCGAMIINDCYNANYDSMKAALDYIGKLPNLRKIAVLGDMLELGEYSKELHEEVGKIVAENKVDMLICVGKESINIAKEAEKGGVKNIVHCNTNKEAISILKEKLNLEENPNFIGTRKGILDPNTLSLEERNQLIKEQPAYGNIICRCEMITEGEIIDAIRRPLGAKSLDGVKRRTRAGMGRCQAGFCSPKTMEILERELSISMFDITKAGGESNMVLGLVKDSI